MTDPGDRLRKAIEIGVLAPIGLASVLHDELPKLAQRGRERVEQRVVVARFIGAMVVAQGRRELERRLQPPAPVEPASTVETRPDAPAVPSGVSETAGSTVDADDLPIDDYESLSASQVIAVLGELSPSELELVEAFERAHRGRRTVLGRIEQIRAR